MVNRTERERGDRDKDSNGQAVRRFGKQLWYQPAGWGGKESGGTKRRRQESIKNIPRIDSQAGTKEGRNAQLGQESRKRSGVGGAVVKEGSKRKSKGVGEETVQGGGGQRREGKSRREGRTLAGMKKVKELWGDEHRESSRRACVRFKTQGGRRSGGRGGSGGKGRTWRSEGSVGPGKRRRGKREGCYRMGACQGEKEKGFRALSWGQRLTRGKEMHPVRNSPEQGARVVAKEMAGGG